MDLSFFLSVVASLMHLVAFAMYNLQMRDPKFKPNAATWTLWAVLTATNATAYFHASNDWVKAILPAASSVACILTFFFTLVRGKFEKLPPWDLATLAIGMVAIPVWHYSQSAAYANLVLQGAIFVSFVPTYRSTWRDPNAERSPPWLMWGAAYGLLTYVVFIRSSGHWTDYVHPVQGAIMHAAVAPLTWRKR